MTQIAAVLYLAIVAGVIVFQFCLVAGAPWGRLTQGGTREGVLPIAGRVAAGLSVPVLVCMAAGLTSAAGMSPHWPKWTAYVALAVQVLSTFLNWITTSRAERLLWGPVTTVMLLLAVYVIFGQ